MASSKSGTGSMARNSADRRLNAGSCSTSCERVGAETNHQQACLVKADRLHDLVHGVHGLQDRQDVREPASHRQAAKQRRPATHLVLAPSNMPVSMKKGHTHVVLTPALRSQHHTGRIGLTSLVELLELEAQRFVKPHGAKLGRAVVHQTRRAVLRGITPGASPSGTHVAGHAGDRHNVPVVLLQHRCKSQLRCRALQQHHVPGRNALIVQKCAHVFTCTPHHASLSTAHSTHPSSSASARPGTPESSSPSQSQHCSPESSRRRSASTISALVTRQWHAPPS